MSNTILSERYAESVIGGREADFEGLELRGVRVINPSSPDAVIEVDDEQPELYSVYACAKTGGVSCVGDFTLYADALRYAEDISTQWNWPIKDCCAEIPFLEQFCLGLATSLFVGDDNGYEGTWFNRYQYLASCVEKEVSPDGWSPWKPFENREWTAVISEIDNHAELLHNSIKEILDLAHKGIVHAALNDTLDLDMNQLDLEYMLELGSTLSDQSA